MLDIVTSACCRPKARAVKGGAHFQIDHGAGVQRQEPAPTTSASTRSNGDRADKAVLK